MTKADPTLVFALVAGLAMLLVAALGTYVASRTPTRLDVEAAAFRGVGTTAAAFFTSLGYWPALSMLGALAIVALSGRTTPWWLAAAVVASHTLAQAVIAAVKPVFARTRPDYFIVRREVDTSYPSGHAATAMTFYAAIAVLVWHAHLPQTIALGAATALAICAVAIPWSRLALGAHYLTDIAGGLLFGGGWLAASFALYAAYAR